MRKQLLVIGSALCFFGASAQEQEFTLRGELEGIQNNEVYLLLRTETGTDTLARSAVNGNSFELKGRLEEPALCLLSTGPAEGIRLFMENTEMTITGKLPDTEITGSKSHEQLEKMATLSPRLTEIQQKLGAISQAYREAASSNDTARGEDLLEQATSLIADREAARQDYEDRLTEYIRTQPATFATPYIILSTFHRPDPNAFLPAFEKFPPEVQNSMLGKVLKARLDELAPTAVGKKAPEITGKTPEGEEISLSGMKGKITLIDFWASWCGPCRRENPNVVRLYEKYHAKGFNILGVSLDKDAASWKQAIAADGLEWSHVSDLKEWDSELIKPYAVSAIPHTVLIDENGIIIAANLRGKALEDKLAEVLGD
ncbi:TlpA disulfide reductase family protein [Anseongella ginsenosidimutans]|uniref:TlpA disulfide reductase family protein n=1 Tax=Anseongella ginsenosidimutans TaxID=496056 RepID=UPI0013159494|nr:TlpA disulfide reductase family protein [Anseongella ginsenosidimutans]